jgi:hypothetical protein
MTRQRYYASEAEGRKSGWLLLLELTAGGGMVDPILAGILTTVAGEILVAVGRRADEATSLDSPVAAAIARVATQTVNAEVLPALESWRGSPEFRQSLDDLTCGRRDFSADTLIDSFVAVGGLYAGEQTKQLAAETLRSFGMALEEAVMGAGGGLAVHDRHERRRFTRLEEKVDQLLGARPNPSMAGWWQRFDSYEFREGWIRPAPGASLTEYDPWQEHGAQGQGVYRGLCALSERMRESSKIVATSGGQLAYEFADPVGSDVLDWCSQHGLLGVLLNMADSVVLPARWRASPTLSSLLWGDPPPCHPSITTYRRVNGGWSIGGHTYPFPADDDELERRRHAVPGTIVGSTDRHESWPAPGVAIRKLGEEEARFEAFGETWSRYFPDVPSGGVEICEYPPPLTDGFWIQYGERVEDFMNAAIHFAQALEWVEQGHRRSLDELEDGKPAKWWRFTTGHRWMEELIQPVSPVLNRQENGEFESLWASPSLLSSLAMMAFLDLTSG